MLPHRVQKSGQKMNPFSGLIFCPEYGRLKMPKIRGQLFGPRFEGEACPKMTGVGRRSTAPRLGRRTVVPVPAIPSQWRRRQPCRPAARGSCHLRASKGVFREVTRGRWRGTQIGLGQGRSAASVIGSDSLYTPRWNFCSHLPVCASTTTKLKLCL